MLLRFKIKWHKSGLARYFCAWQVFVGTIADTRRLVCLICGAEPARRAARRAVRVASAVLSAPRPCWQALSRNGKTRCAALQAELDAQRLARRSQIDRYMLRSSTRRCAVFGKPERRGRRPTPLAVAVRRAEEARRHDERAQVSHRLGQGHRGNARAARTSRGCSNFVLNGKLTAAWKQLKGHMNSEKQIEELEALEKAQREEKTMMQQARQAKTLQAIAIMRHSCQVKVLTGWHEYIGRRSTTRR